MHLLIYIICLTFINFGIIVAQNTTVTGEFTVEHPTLLNLGFEWAISGDANRNAAVDVHFRAVGETSWRTALPLVRIGGERIFRAPEMSYGYLWLTWDPFYR